MKKKQKRMCNRFLTMSNVPNFAKLLPTIIKVPYGEWVAEMTNNKQQLELCI